MKLFRLLRLGIVPQQLKIAKVAPFYKAGDKTKLINYRPIPILPCLSKILERLINNHMMKFIKIYRHHNMDLGQITPLTMPLLI